MAKRKSIICGFIVGGIVSAAATLLSTPASGKEMRTNIKNQREEVAKSFERIKNDGSLLAEQITQTSKEGAALIKDLSLDVKDSIESWKHTIEPHQKRIQTHLAQIEDRLKELEQLRTN